MAVLDSGNVTTKQTRALFNVTLGEFLGLAHFAEAVANNHGGIVTLRRLEGKPGGHLKNHLSGNGVYQASEAFSLEP